MVWLWLVFFAWLQGPTAQAAPPWQLKRPAEWSEGEIRTFHVRYLHEGKERQTGRWTVKRIPAAGDQRILWTTFEPSDPRRRGPMRLRIDVPDALVTISEDGEMALRLPDARTPSPLLRFLVATWIHSPPPKKRAESWRATEMGPQGLWEVDYTLEPDGSVRRQWAEVVPPDTRAFQDRRTFGKALGTLSFDDQGSLVGATWSWGPADSRSELHLDATEASTLPDDLSARIDATLQLHAFRIDGHPICYIGKRGVEAFEHALTCDPATAWGWYLPESWRIDERTRDRPRDAVDVVIAALRHGAGQRGGPPLPTLPDGLEFEVSQRCAEVPVAFWREQVALADEDGTDEWDDEHGTPPVVWLRALGRCRHPSEELRALVAEQIPRLVDAVRRGEDLPAGASLLRSHALRHESLRQPLEEALVEVARTGGAMPPFQLLSDALERQLDDRDDLGPRLVELFADFPEELRAALAIRATRLDRASRLALLEGPDTWTEVGRCRPLADALHTAPAEGAPSAWKALRTCDPSPSPTALLFAVMASEQSSSLQHVRIALEAGDYPLAWYALTKGQLGGGWQPTWNKHCEALPHARDLMRWAVVHRPGMTHELFAGCAP